MSGHPAGRALLIAHVVPVEPSPAACIRAEFTRWDPLVNTPGLPGKSVLRDTSLNAGDLRSVSRAR
jgi:hypothetical protein